MRVPPYRVLRYGLFVLAVLSGIAGCATRSVNRDPAPLLEAPAAYSMEAGKPGHRNCVWWERFDDARLDGLIEGALEKNLTVAQALERISRARFLLWQSRTGMFPQIDATALGERTYERERTKSPPDEFDAAAGEGGSSGELPPETTESYDSEFRAGLSLSWELDLWGRLRSEARARGEELAGSLHDYEALRLLLSGQVASAYYQAIEARLQYSLLMEQLSSSRTILELLELRFQQGAASMVDVLQQRGQVAGIEAEIPVVEGALRLAENRIDVLLGDAPDGADRTAAEENPGLPVEAVLPPIGIPADLLQHRPDLKALQRQVVAADYRIGAAIAERLPRITLDGSMFYGEDPETVTSSMAGAAGLIQPFLDWGARKAAVKSARSELRESLLAYTSAYLTALEEVENTLYREARQRELISVLARREEILERTLEETRLRYELGVTDYLPVLTAIQDLQEIQRELLRQQGILVSLRIELHKATGGPVTPPSEERTPDKP